MAQQSVRPKGSDFAGCRKKAVAAAAGEARKNGWFMAIAVTDPNGHLLYFERMDNTQIGSVNIAIRKAQTAAQFKRPSKVFQDLIAKGDSFTYLLGLEGAMPVRRGADVKDCNRGRHRRVLATGGTRTASARWRASRR